MRSSVTVGRPQPIPATPSARLLVAIPHRTAIDRPDPRRPGALDALSTAATTPGVAFGRHGSAHLVVGWRPGHGAGSRGMGSDAATRLGPARRRIHAPSSMAGVGRHGGGGDAPARRRIHAPSSMAGVGRHGGGGDAPARRRIHAPSSMARVGRHGEATAARVGRHDPAVPDGRHRATPPAPFAAHCAPARRRPAPGGATPRP
jgi:hypothetical protein